jgi:integrase/ribosomal protein L40E
VGGDGGSMAQNDIYDSERLYNEFKAKINGLTAPPVQGDKRRYYVKNKANLTYYWRLCKYFESKDTSFVRRLRLLRTFNIITFATAKDLKDCAREDIDGILALMHGKLKRSKSKSDFIKDLKHLWRQLFPEKDSQGRPDDDALPYPVRHLKRFKIDKSQEKARNDKLSLDEFERIVAYFGNDVRLQSFITLAWESLGRPQEILYCRLRDVEQYDNYAVVHVASHGKEGIKSLQCIDSFPYLQRWLDVHPKKGDKDSFLFVNQGNSNKCCQMKPENVNKHIRTALKYLKIDKNITCYSLKRNGVTIRRLRGESDVEIQRIAGWTSTKQLQTYDKSNFDEVLRIQLIKRGLAKPQENEAHLIPQVKLCSVCGARAAPTDINCPKCLRPLDREKLKQMENAEFASKLKEFQDKIEQELAKIKKKIKNGNGKR